jgi:iron complex transport system substrate-binding protein
MPSLASILARVPPCASVVALAAAIGLASACRVEHVPGAAGFPAVSVVPPLTSNLTDGCVRDYDETVDYFPDKTRITYARQFQIAYHRHYKVIDFTPSVYTQERFRYVLVQCGTPVPPHGPSDRVVTVPVSRVMISNSPSYGGALARLGAVDRLVGIASERPYTTPQILDRVRAGLTHEVGSGPHSSIELAVALKPDILLTFYSAYPQFNMHPKLWELGVVAVPLADHFEGDPLARAEWIKLLAAFLNREREADAIVDPAAARYEALAARAATVRDRPRMMLGFFDTQDVWYLNGGRNYMAQLIRDAGGEYFWNDDRTASLLRVNFERVFLEGSETTRWFAGFGVVRTKSTGDLVARHPRLRHLPPVERHEVYGSDAGLTPRGASPYTDQSLDKPDVLLADVMKILHPELLPEHQFVFFRKLE